MSVSLSLLGAYIKAIAKLQQLGRLIPRRAKQSCSSTSSGQTRHTGSQQFADKEVGRGRDDERRCQEMSKDKDKGDADSLGEAVGVGETPRQCSQEKEEGEKIGE